MQRGRILDRTAQAPKLFAGTVHEIVDFSSDVGSDLDYYIFELARLREVARIVIEKFGRPSEIVEALSAFDTALPHLRSIRDPLTHPSGDHRLDDVMWFDSVVKVGPHGSVEYLVDPRYQHHNAAIELSEALSKYLAADLPAH